MTHHPKLTLRNLVVAMAVSLSLFALSACSGGNEPESKGANTGEQTSQDQAAINEAVQKQLEE